MQKKRVLQINSVINSGSTGRIAEEIGLKAISNDWESYIAYGRNDRPSKSHKIKIGNKLDIYWHVLITRLSDRHGLGSKRATKRLIKEIEKVQPDIIHLHNIHGYYLNYEIFFEYLKATNTPIVWTLHDCWIMTGHCAHFDYIKCDKWKSHCNFCPQRYTYPKSFYDRSFNNYKLKKKLFCSKAEDMTLVPVSEWLSNILSNSFLYKSPKKNIHNGIDINTFSPQKSTLKNSLGIDDKFVIIGVASIWDARKGLEDFKKLSEQLNDDEIILLIGLSEKQISELPKDIIGITRTENVKQLAEFYSIADVFVNPTWEDSYPTTNLEATACGTPIITYKTGGSPESVSPETGFVVEKGNLGELRKVINTIKQNGKSFYSIACRERAVKMFNKEDRYAEYIELYEELLQGKRGD